MMTEAEATDLLSPAKFPGTTENRRLLAAIIHLCYTNAGPKLAELRASLLLSNPTTEQLEIMDRTFAIMSGLLQEIAQNALHRAPSLPQAPQ